MMRARFPGFCKRGKHAIAIGDEIGRDGLRGWAHGPCLNRPDPRPAPNAANAFLDRIEDEGNAAERRMLDQEYAAGIEDANRERFNRQMFGERYAAAEEYARDMRGLNGEW